MHAQRAAQMFAEGMFQFQPLLDRLVAEGRRHHAVVDFVVPVVDVAAGVAQRLQPAFAQPLGAGVDPTVVHADAHPVVAAMAVPGRRRYAVLVRRVVHRCTEQGIADEHAAAQRAGCRLRIAVVEPAAAVARVDQPELLFHRCVVDGAAGDAAVAAVAAEHAAVQRKQRVPAVEAQGMHALGTIAVEARVEGSADQATWHAGRNAFVADVDHPADGAAAVPDGGRATQDADAFGQRRIGSRSVVGTEGGGVMRTAAVVQHLHACAAQPADHRQTDAGAEGGVVHAGFFTQGVAQRARLAVAQRLAAQRAGAPGWLGRGVGQALGLDLHVGQFDLGSGLRAGQADQREVGEQQPARARVARRNSFSGHGGAEGDERRRKYDNNNSVSTKNGCGLSSSTVLVRSGPPFFHSCREFSPCICHSPPFFVPSVYRRRCS